MIALQMPLFVVERKFAEQLDLSDDDVKRFEAINSDEGIRWLHSFLSADRKRSYCLYEAPSAEAILAASKKTLPIEAIVEVDGSVPGLHAKFGELAVAQPGR